MLNSYKLRNFILGITPSSTRKLIPGRYLDNIMALEEIIESAKRKDIKVLVYIVPIRDDVKIPYDLKDYKSFKSSVMSMGNNELIEVVNFEKIVPVDYWGTKKSTSINNDIEELDFMHFQSEGHELLSERIFMELKN